MGGITQAIKIAERDFSKKLYFKEDIEKLIFDLENCIKDKKTDTEQTVRMKILRMFASYGIELEKTLTPEQYREQLELQSIQSVKDFPEMCWNEMMKFNLVYKTPKEYMERLVNELVAPEYNLPDSPIRLKILKQILGKLDCLRGTSFQSKKLINIIENDYDGLISNIGDEIFDNYLVPIQPYKYLRVLLDVYGDLLYKEDEEDDDLASLVSMYNDSITGKTAKQILQFIRSNNSEEKIDTTGEKSDSFNVVNFDRSLVEQISNYLDGVRVAFKEKYDEELESIKLLEQEIYIQQFPIIMQFIHEHRLFEQLKTKRFINLVKSHMSIEIEMNNVDSNLIEAIMDYPLSAEAKEKFNNYLVKQIGNFFKKADAAFRVEYNSFVANLNRIETDCYLTQYDAIECFIRKRGLCEQLLTGEIKNIALNQQEDDLEVITSGNELMEQITSAVNDKPIILKRIILLLIEKIDKFKAQTNEMFDKGVDRAKDNGSIPRILKISDDLAEGKYKRSSEMKEILYLFAFAFDMSISFVNDKERTLRDVRKSLFEDFYCDNIIRYVNEYQKNGVYEEPTGVTIQFKNFVEIVYLYWLNKDSKTYSPAEKYLAANAMIEQVVSKIKSAERYIEKTTSQTGKKYFEAKKRAEKKAFGTYAYRNFVRTDSEYGDKTLKIDNFLNLPENDFLNIILDRFDVDTAIKYKTSAAFDNENYQTTAEEKIKELITGLTAKVTHTGGLVSNFYPIEFYKSIFDESVLDKEHCEDSHAKLFALVEKVNEQMESVLFNHLTITKKGNDGKPQKITCRITGKDYDKTFKTSSDKKAKKIVIEHFPAGDYTITEITDEIETGNSKSIKIKCLSNQNIKINISDERIECDYEDQITRTRYMLLYYYDFVQSRMGISYAETFDDFYDEYCESLNIDLEDCSYQLFSEKNLIDMMLLYSAFITLRTEL